LHLHERQCHDRGALSEYRDREVTVCRGCCSGPAGGGVTLGAEHDPRFQ